MPIFTRLKLGVLLCLFLPALGCAGFGKLQVECAYDCHEEVLALMNDFSRYHVYYAGQDPDLAAAILFDPGDDSRRIQPGRWKRIGDKEMAWEVIRNLEADPEFYPKFMRVLGEKGNVFGYLYSPYQHVPVKQQDVGVISIYNLRQPAHLQFEGGSERLNNFNSYER